MQRTLFLRGSY